MEYAFFCKGENPRENSGSEDAMLPPSCSSFSGADDGGNICEEFESWEDSVSVL